MLWPVAILFGRPALEKRAKKSGGRECTRRLSNSGILSLDTDWLQNKETKGPHGILNQQHLPQGGQTLVVGAGSANGIGEGGCKVDDGPHYSCILLSIQHSVERADDGFCQQRSLRLRIEKDSLSPGESR